MKIIIAISSLNLGEVKNNTIDTFGDAYEYLMNMYASSAGKSGGEFFTPQEVSELNVRIEGIVKHQNELRTSLDEIIKNLEVEA